jgi:hypothetical protein
LVKIEVPVVEEAKFDGSPESIETVFDRELVKATRHGSIAERDESWTWQHQIG